MKKVLYFIGAMFALASCTTKEDGAIDISAVMNEQEAAKTIVFKAEGTEIDYEGLTAETVQLFVPTLVAEDEAVTTYTAEVSAEGVDVLTLEADENGYVSAADIKSFVENTFGKSRAERELSVKVFATTIVGSLSIINTAEVTTKVLLPETKYGEFIYVPGNDQGGNASWNPEKAAALQSPDCDGLYTGYAYLDGDFKFTLARDWSAEYNFNDFAVLPAGFVQGGGTNISAPAAGLYYITVDVRDLENASFTAVLIENMNLVGNFNGWNPADDAQQMTWNKDELCFVKTGAAVASDGWKFTANNGWDINLGGTIDNLVANGDNLSVVGTTIKLYPCRTTSDKIFATVE